MATIRTVREERAAIARLLTDVTGVVNLWDYEPKQIGRGPAITVTFVGFAPPEAANLRQAKQSRIYHVRAFFPLEDAEICQNQIADILPEIWDRLVGANRLNDSENVIFTSVSETQFMSYKETRSQNIKQFVEVLITLMTEHRSPYVR